MKPTTTTSWFSCCTLKRTTTTTLKERIGDDNSRTKVWKFILFFVFVSQQSGTMKKYFVVTFAFFESFFRIFFFNWLCSSQHYLWLCISRKINKSLKQRKEASKKTLSAQNHQKKLITEKLPWILREKKRTLFFTSFILLIGIAMSFLDLNPISFLLSMLNFSVDVQQFVERILSFVNSISFWSLWSEIDLICCSLFFFLSLIALDRYSREMEREVPVFPHFSEEHKSDLLWGTYRPNLYFGMRTRTGIDAILTGILWYQWTSSINNLRIRTSSIQSLSCPHSFLCLSVWRNRFRYMWFIFQCYWILDFCNHTQEIRHIVRNEDKVRYWWQQHNGRDYGTQLLNDTLNEIELQTTFIKIPGKNGGDWIVRISGSSSRYSKIQNPVVSLLFYFGIEQPNRGHLKLLTPSYKERKPLFGPVRFSGYTPLTRDFIIDIRSGIKTQQRTLSHIYIYICTLPHSEDTIKCIIFSNKFCFWYKENESTSPHTYFNGIFTRDVWNIQRYLRIVYREDLKLPTLDNTIPSHSNVFIIQKYFKLPFQVRPFPDDKQLIDRENPSLLLKRRREQRESVCSNKEWYSLFWFFLTNRWKLHSFQMNAIDFKIIPFWINTFLQLLVSTISHFHYHHIILSNE